MRFHFLFVVANNKKNSYQYKRKSNCHNNPKAYPNRVVHIVIIKKTIGLNTSPIKTNNKPPINSHFQATIRMPNKIKEGIKCKAKLPSCCQMVSPGAKESAAKRLIKRIATIQIIRGNQCKILSAVFMLFFFKAT